MEQVYSYNLGAGTGQEGWR